MPKTILRQFMAMRASVRSIIFLFWIYAFTGSMVGVFTQIFLYQKFASLTLNTFAAIVFYTGIMVGFCVPGLAAARWHLNIKQGFLWSFLVMGASLLYLLRVTNVTQAYAAMFVWGVGQGIYWLTVNTFELSETEDGERDLYASLSSAGDQILSLGGPALATLLIWLSSAVLHWGAFTMLFSVAPVIYLLGFFCFSSIRDYRPQQIRGADFKHFFLDRQNQAAQLYTAGTGIQHSVGTVIPPLVILLILGSAIRVGMYDTLFAIFSALCILVVARYRTPSNRLFIYGVTSLCLALATMWFGFAFSFAALVIYTVVEGLLSPVMNVSSHVIDLSSMEIGRSESDFYATMILRDFFLWVWRCAGGVLLLGIIEVLGTDRLSLSVGLYLLAAGLVIRFAGAYLLQLTHRAAVAREALSASV